MWIPIFLLFNLWSIALSLSDSVKMEACAPAKCGSVDISYPFWISKTQPDYCGYPSLEINCQDDKPFLVQSYDTNYYIDRVFYDNSSFLLMDSILVNGSTSCSIPRFNVSLGVGPIVVSETNKELVFFFNCERKDPLPVDILRVTCDANQSDAGNESFVRLLQNYNDDPGASGESLSNCSISRIPVSGWNGSTVDQYTTLMSDGFLVELKVASCSDCRKSNGQCGFNTTTSMFMCICSDQNMYPMSCNPKRGKNRDRHLIIIISVFVPLLIIGCFLGFLFIRKLRYAEPDISQEEKMLVTNNKTLDLWSRERNSDFPLFDFNQIANATGNFSLDNKLGEGGFGPVYKGLLQDGFEIAVKRLSSSSGQGLVEFKNEIQLIAKLQHRNLVQLVGWCIQGEEKILIYEFMPNKSLDYFIFAVTWLQSMHLRVFSQSNQMYSALVYCFWRL